MNGYWNAVVQELGMRYDNLRRSYSYDNGLENKNYSGNDCCVENYMNMIGFDEAIGNIDVNWSYNFYLRSCGDLRSFGK